MHMSKIECNECKDLERKKMYVCKNQLLSLFTKELEFESLSLFKKKKRFLLQLPPCTH